MINRNLFLVSLLFFAFWGWGAEVSAQARVRILSLDTGSETVTLQNFGNATANIGGYNFCLGPGQYNVLSDYTNVTGSLSLAPNATVTFDLTSGSAGVTALPSVGGLGLFINPSFGSNSPNDLGDYVQWGAANQPRVGQAVTAGRWTNGNDFVSGNSPYNFTGGANDIGPSFWSATVPAIVRFLEIDTQNETVTLKNFGGTTENISGYNFCLGPGQYNVLSNYTNVTGSLNLAPNATVTFDLTSGSAGVTALPNTAGLGLFINPSFGSNSPNDLGDYVQWGAANQPRVGQAVTAGRWTNANDFVAGLSPYTYNGGANDVGPSFWSPTIPAIVRFLEIDTQNETVTLKNFGGTTENISGYNFCLGPGQYNVLSNYTNVTGSLNLAPNATVTFDLTSGSAGVTALPNTAGLGLFINPSFGSNSPNDLGDYVQWGAGNQARVGQAVTAGRWTNANDFVAGLSPYTYNGGANDVGPSFWSPTIPAIVRFLEIDTQNETVTLQNFGGTTEDVSGYNFCLGPGQYNVLSNYTNVTGSLNLAPGATVTFDLTSGSAGVTALPDTAGLGLFINPSFGSNSPNDLGDYVQWGAGNQARVGQAVTAGRWTNANDFVGNNSPFTYVGGANDVGPSFWNGTVAPAAVRFLEIDTQNESVTLQNFGGTTEDVSGYNFCLGPGQYNVLSNYTNVTGSLNLAPGATVTFDLTSGSAGVTALPDTAGLGLFINPSFGSNSPNDLGDYVQWGAGNQARVGQAVTAGRWTNANDFVGNNSPFTYVGGANDVGPSFWNGTVAPAAVRFLEIDTQNESVTLQNFGGTTEDVSGYNFCLGPGQYNVLSNYTNVTGSLNLAPGATVTFDLTSGSAGVTALPDTAGLGLFINPSFGSNSPNDLGDYVQWGAGNQARVGQAVTAGRWTNANDFVGGFSPFSYIGGAADIGPAFWNGSAAPAAVRFLEIDTDNETVTLINFGGTAEDVSTYNFCLGPGQYNVLSNYTNVTGSLNLAPGATVTFDLTSGSAGVTALPATGGLGLFINPVFGSNSPTDLGDYVQWGAANQARVGQAVTAGRWTNANDFVAGASPFVYLGDADDIGPSFWVDNTIIRLTRIIPEGDTVVVKNFDSVTRDVSDYFFCTLAGVYPRLGNSAEVEIVSGDLVLSPNEEVVLRVLTFGGVVDSVGSLFLFNSNLLGFNNDDANVLRDFAQWGAGNGFRVGNAVNAGRWDNVASFIPGDSPFDYVGGANDVGASFWISQNNPNAEVFAAKLTGAQEVDPKLTTAGGLLRAELIGNTLVVSGSVFGLSSPIDVNIAGGAHIHNGVAGTNGPIEVILNPSIAPDGLSATFSPSNNTFTLTQAQIDDLRARGLYVNIHTLNFGPGEVRGQILAADPNESLGSNFFSTNLFGSNEVGVSVISEAFGAVVFDLIGDTLTASGSFSNLTDSLATDIAGGVHVHLGFAGQNGGIELLLNTTLGSDYTSGTFEAANNSFVLTSAQKAYLQGRQLYVNLHSNAFRSGELRGQIVGMPSVLFRAFLSGAQEVPSVITAAEGQVITELFGTDSVLSTGSFQGFGSDFNPNAAGGAHLHSAVAGQNAGIAIFLTPSINADNRSGQFEVAGNKVAVDSASLASLLGRGLYVNLHSIDNASGEIRGQVVPEANYFFYGLLSATQEVTPQVSEASGTVVLEKRFGKIVATGSFNDLENGFNESVAGGAHIHVGLAGQNGGIQFFLNPDLNASESVGIFSASNNTFDISETKADTLKERRLYVNIHSDSIVSGELRAQLLGEAQNYFFSPLSGASELIPVKSDGFGNTASEWLNGSLTTSGSFSSLGSAFDVNVVGGAHIHFGLAGQNGPIQLLLTTDLAPDQLNGEFASANNVFDLSAGLTDTLINRQLYVNIHSVDNGSGELRGQILPPAEAYFTTTVSGANEVQPVISTAVGGLKVELTNGKIVATGRFSNFIGDFDVNVAGGSHLHFAKAGQNGGIEVVLIPELDGDLKGGNFQAVDNGFDLTSDQEDKLFGELLYLNLHSTVFGSGEARGQILAESNSFPEPGPSITAPASGAAITIEGDSSTVFEATWTASTDDNCVVYLWELSASKDFAAPLLFVSTGETQAFTTDFATVDALLANNGIAVGQSIKLFHRATASDGAIQHPGAIDSVILTRGLLVDGIAAPTNLAITYDTQFLPVLTWEDNSNNEDGFNIERKIGNGNYIQVATVGTDVETYTDTVVVFGVDISYRVNAFNASNTSDFSNVATFQQPAQILDLELDYICYDAISQTITWEVFNPNSINVFYIYATWANNPRQQDTLIATPGITSFVTNVTPQSPATPFDDNTTGIWWIDENLTPDQPFDVFGDRGNERIDLNIACSVAGRVIPPDSPNAPQNLLQGQLAGLINVVINATDIEEEVIRDIDVRPNPFSDRLIIEAEEVQGTASIRVLDAFGKLVFSTEANLAQKAELQLEGLTNGLYFVEIRHAEFVQTVKVLKQ